MSIEVLIDFIIIIILESAVQGQERVRTLSVQRPQPHTTNPFKEEKYKTVGDKKKRADHANRKAMALLLKPTSHSNTPNSRHIFNTNMYLTHFHSKIIIKMCVSKSCFLKFQNRFRHSLSIGKQ